MSAMMPSSDGTRLLLAIQVSQTLGGSQSKVIHDCRVVACARPYASSLGRFHAFRLKVLLQTRASDAVVTFPCGMAVGVHDVHGFKISTADDPVNDAPGDLQLAGDFLHSHPFTVRRFAGTLQHTEEAFQIGKKLPAQRTAVGVRQVLIVLVVLELRFHYRWLSAARYVSSLGTRDGTNAFFFESTARR